MCVRTYTRVNSALLAKAPNNTAAIHYYIHAAEVAGHPQSALPYAEKLGRLAPNASHLIHMAAHTFYHVGRYEDAVIVNASAMRTDSDHLEETKTSGGLSGAPLPAIPPNGPSTHRRVIC